MSTSKLLQHDLVRHRRKLSVVGGAVAMSVAVVMLLGSVAAGLYLGVVKPLLPKLPLGLLQVESKTMSVGLFAFDSAKFGGGLDQAALKRIKRIDGVAEVYPTMGAAFPMRASGGEGFIGRRLRTDVFGTGVSEELVKDDIAKGYNFQDKPGGPIPVVVSRRLLDLYNTTVAPSLKKPKLSAEMVIGFQFQLTVGTSYAQGTPDPRKVSHLTAQVVGFSDQATLVGVTVPIETMRRWNQRFGEKNPPLTGAWVRTKDPSLAGPVSQSLSKMGLKVDETPKLIGAALVIVSMLAGMFGGTLLILSAFAIAQTFFLMVSERKSEFAILRALGAGRKTLFRLILGEAMIVGAVASLVGMVLGGAVGLILDSLLMSQLPDLPLKPAQLVAFPTTLLLAAFLQGTLAALVGAFWPALRAGATEPAAALRS